ncbi:TerC/Alx family metal homeostasis membrane protein [Thorsellia anophelis]|uniref:Tellurite resistance protein TerC n=1 Tax=Thorsellia anophelis DSM 18579 TaxID=1123402 RepID=A0A1I0EP18_9GAMM|nr:TerC/Alx family metal homeostasis membrane protein [Thorsellia anophelis]SET46764.1 tellurite resistance protein TerC [Thorsellia anophelis DSM 18579]
MTAFFESLLNNSQIQTTLVFVVLAVGAICIDLFMHRDDKPISLKSAIAWSIFWIGIALVFAVYLYFFGEKVDENGNVLISGKEMSSLYLTGYALEKVLSVDNLFVIMAIFSWFAVPEGVRHRVLYWGIIGAIVFRGIFVAIGTGLLALGPWVEVLFAIIVGWTAVMMLKSGDDDDEIEDYSQHLAYRMVKKFFPVWPKIYGNKFFMRQSEVDVELAKPENAEITIGRVQKATWYATPLLLCLAVVELSDVMFAFDSVPAVIAVSREPIIVYSAMMFAILGLRTLYFVLEALKGFLAHLEKAVIVLLFFIAFKLGLNATDHLFHHGYGISATVSLIVVLVVLAIGIIASVMFPEKAEDETKSN